MNRIATLGLPLRFVVSIIIGTTILSSVIYYLNSTCLYPQQLQIEWHPYYIENEKKNVIYVEVKGKNHPIANAEVVVKGLGNASYGKTNESGVAVFYFTPHLPYYRDEGYISIDVKAGRCYKEFYQKKAIKVVRQN